MKINEIEYSAPEHHLEIMNKHNMYTDSKYDVMLMAFFQKIKDDCQPFLKAINYDVKHYWLTRGVNNSEEDFITRRVRLKDRNPRDTPYPVHQLLNDYFTKKFGEPFRNAMFATNSLEQATEYAFGGLTEGERYLVYPTGNFTFIWSPEIFDLLDILQYYNLHAACTAERAATPQFQETFNKLKTEKLSTYTNKDLKAAIKSRNEVMIRCIGYHGIKWPLTSGEWGAFQDLVTS
jgi:hypothetical protein